MSAASKNITIDQGSDWALELVIKDSGIVRDITGYSGRAQMRPTKTSTTLTATFTCVVTAVEGKVVMSLPAATSASITPGVYFYDLEIYTAADAAVSRLLKGKATVDAEVTR